MQEHDIGPMEGNGSSTKALNGLKGGLEYSHLFSPEATVVVPAYNEQKVIARTLASLIQTVRSTRAWVDVIVVDNGSTDETASIAQYAGAHVVHQQNKGVSYARQTGLEEARGKIVLGTDADTIVPSTWIDAHLRHYSWPSVVGVAGKSTLDKVHPIYTCYSVMASAVRKMHEILKREKLDTTQCGRNFSYVRDDALQVGYEEGVNLGEDTLMSMKLSERGDIMWDGSADITALSDGRRYRRPGAVGELAMRRVRNLFSGKLYGKPEKGDFDDIRE